MAEGVVQIGINVVVLSMKFEKMSCRQKLSSYVSLALSVFNMLAAVVEYAVADGSYTRRDSRIEDRAYAPISEPEGTADLVIEPTEHEEHLKEEKPPPIKHEISDVSTEGKKRVEEWKDGHDFWFVSAEKLKSSKGNWPVHKDIEKQSGWLKKRKISLSDCLKPLMNFAAVSHVWCSHTDHPDPLGEQADQLRSYLQKNPQIEWVWIDWSCLPQGRRTDSEEVLFTQASRFACLIYLSMVVVKILDSKYLNRFWTQYEAWLSYQRVDFDGFSPSQGRRSDCIFTGLALTNEREEINQRKLVLDKWASVDMDAMTHRLKRSQVRVTKESDKHGQLSRVQELHTVAAVFLREMADGE
jgi:hypothetical protein